MGGLSLAILLLLGLGVYYYATKHPDQVKALLSGKKKTVTDVELEELRTRAASKNLEASRVVEARQLRQQIKDADKKINGVKP